MAVLCYDPIGQGERNQLLDKAGKPAIAGTSEHTMIGVGALLVGQSTATYRIWDGIRSLDYLASRPEVDPKRLGCTGNSGGGTLTAYLMALDDRISAAAPSCYLTTLEKLFATIGPQDAEQNITGQVAFGMEHADYLTMRAPRPTLMAVATQDYFNIDGAWTTFREASLVYGKLGHGERVALFEFDDKHGFSKPRREAAMRWLRRWLVGKDDAPSEGDVKILTDAELQCTRSGQVLEDFQGKSAFQLNVDHAKTLAGARAKYWQWEKSAPPRNEILRLLGLPRAEFPPTDSKGKRLADFFPQKAERRKGFLYAKTTFSTEPGIEVPIALFWPEEGKGKLTLYVHGDGFGIEAAPGGEIERLAQSGHAVVAIDLRGMGETAPRKPSSKLNYFGNDIKEAFLAIHLNRPLLGQRLHDLLCLVDYWAKRMDNVEVIAVGSAGPVALHAAALDRRVSKLTLEKSLISWQNVVETPISYNQFTNVVPGALRVYDLPDLAAMIAPRPLTIREAVDALGRPVGREGLISAYKVCRQRYGQLGAENLVLSP
jgi:cephalosporin-C deacetylase-like acetyl esterase